MDSFASSTLLNPLTTAQQRVVDLISDAFLHEDYEWPIYDYIELTLEAEGSDAWQTLQSFPTVGRWSYGHVGWIRSGSVGPPDPGSEVYLSIVGMWHSNALRRYLPVFFGLLDFMALERKATQPSPREICRTAVTSEDFAGYWRTSRHPKTPHPRLTHQLLEHEPITSFGTRSLAGDYSSWSRDVKREILTFEGISEIADYLERLSPWLEPTTEPAPVLSIPAMKLTAAIDYLNLVWRLTFSDDRLVDLRSAERIASLDQDASSKEEFHSQISVLSDLLRSANKGAAKHSNRKHRDHPLAALGSAITGYAETVSSTRVEEAIASLEAVISLRDSDQHVGASHKALTATRDLGLEYPISDWPFSWSVVSARAVEALGTLRDELRAASE